MALNDVIAQGIQFKMPNMLEQYAQMQQLQGGVQANQLNQMKMQEMQRSLQEQEGLRNYLSTATDLTTPASRMEMLKHGATGLAYGKSLDEAQKAGMERQKASADLVDVKLKQSRQMLEGVTTPDQYLQWHQANHADPILGKYLADRGVSAEQSRARIDAAIAEGPEAFEQMLNASKLGSEKAMENHFIESSSGQQKWASTARKYGTGAAQIIPGTIVNQLATPGELSTAATALAGQKVTMRGQDLLNQRALDRLAQETATGTLTPETTDFLAQTYIQTGTMPPLGMGKAASGMRQKVLDRASQMAMGGGNTAEEAAGTVKTNKAELAGTTAGQRAVGTQSANIAMASTELEKMIPIAEAYVKAIDPTDYPIVNKMGNFIAKSTGDANQVGLATALNSLVNVYARAISPKGIPTVSDKNHAREIVNQAMASGQFGEAFKVMRQESGAAKAAGPEVKAAMRAGNKPPAVGVGVDTSNKWLK